MQRSISVTKALIAGVEEYRKAYGLKSWGHAAVELLWRGYSDWAKTPVPEGVLPRWGDGTRFKKELIEQLDKTPDAFWESIEG